MRTLPILTDEPTRHPGCCVSLSRRLLGTIESLLLQSPPLISTSSSDDSLKRDGPAPEREQRDEDKSEVKGEGEEEEEEEEEEKEEAALLLSIGSGTGLLEELLHTYLQSSSSSSAGKSSRSRWRVEGVEITSHSSVSNNHKTGNGNGDMGINIYLPEDRVNHVLGTWAVSRVASEASALMFVYPRDGALVRRYVEGFMRKGMKNSASESESGSESASVAKSESKPGAECESELVSEMGTQIADTETQLAPKQAPNQEEGSGSKITQVLWLGPKADWPDTGLQSFESESDDFEVLELRDDVGLDGYEMIGVLRQKKKKKFSRSC